MMTRDAKLIAYYASGYSLCETALRFGITHERVRQIILRDSPETLRLPYRFNRDQRVHRPT